MRDATPSAPGPTRRLVTAGALGAVVATLAGCGIRLEDDAPRVPLVPTREPIEAEEELLRLHAAVVAASTTSLVSSDPVAPLLPPLHARQATVLHDALRQRGLPESALTSPSASPTPTPSATLATPSGSAGSGSPRPTAPAVPRRTVAEVEGEVAAAGTGLEGAEAELRPALVAILGQAHAALELAAPVAAPGSGVSPAPSASAIPSVSAEPDVPPPWSSPDALVPLIVATRRATWLLEVAAARSPRAVRTAWLRDIGALESLTSDLVDAAGSSAPPPDLGQTLPRPVTTPAEAATLATEAMTTLLAATGAALRAVIDADPEAAFAALPGWLGTVAAVAHRHGMRLTAFPGLA
ncbi:hypothetical protein ACOCJ5_13980 [Knoellia sp. CPCC 206450]|uniref:hypothetical protein n=1 Tax=Knoellia tibetensis TaxID=3404798 RepID=UPI003B430F48